MGSREFVAGLLAPDGPTYLTADDLDGPHAAAVRGWRAAGAVAAEAIPHPLPGCPHCGDGTPYRAGGRYLCAACLSEIDRRHLLAWPVDRAAFFACLAGRLGFRGGAGPLAGGLWGLGAGRADGRAVECFYHPGGPLSDAERGVLDRYRTLLVLHGGAGAGGPGRWFPVVELLDADGLPAAVGLADLLRVRGAVRFDEATGELRVGGVVAGEVAVGGREYFLLAALARDPDRFVPYADLKRAVLAGTGGADGTDEATFCQKLKSRVKRAVPAVDRLIATTNKGDGYRLRAEAEV